MKKLLQHITTPMDVDHKFLPLFQTGGTKKPIINNRAFEQTRMYGDFLTNNKLRSPEAIIKEIEDKEEVRKQIAAAPPRREEGTIRAAGPRQSVASKTWEVLANPAEAFGYAVRGQRLPDNFSKGESRTSGLNTLTQIVNPFAWVNSAVNAVGSAGETVNNLADGEFEQAATSFLNTGLNTLGALPLLAPESKAAQQALGRFITTRTPVRNVHRLNPIAGKLNQYNRVVGRDAVDDIIASRLVRSGQGVKTEMPWGDKIKTFYRPTPYASFSKGLPQQRYINQVIAEGQEPFVISTNRAMKVSNLGRHGKGSTMFPVDESGSYMRSFPASEVEVFQAVPHWLRGYRRVSVPGSASEYSVRNIRPGASIQTIGNMPTWRESFEAVSRQNNPNFNPDLYANSAYGMRPMTELPEHLKPKLIDPDNLKETGGIIEDDGGQWNHPGDITRIRSKNITMQGVPYPVYAIPNKGKGGIMYPGENYVFPEADYVDEYPMMQKGGQREPIFVSNLKDPRLKAYKDSLAAYENDRLFDQELKRVAKNARSISDIDKGRQELVKKYPLNSVQPIKHYGPEDAPIIYSRKDLKQDIINDLIFKKPVQPIVYRNDSEIPKGYSRLTPDTAKKIGWTGSLKDMWYNPTGSQTKGQSVVYINTLKPQPEVEFPSLKQRFPSMTVEDVDLGYSLPQPKVPTALKTKELLTVSEKPTSYSYSYPSSTGQRNIYFPNRVAWKAFIDQYDGLNTQETTDGANASPGVYSQQRRPNPIFSNINFSQGGQHGGLDRWFAEKWVDVKTGKTCGRQEGENRSYPACRPSRRVSSETPKTSSEMSPSEKAKFKRTKTSSQRIPYNHKRK